MDQEYYSQFSIIVCGLDSVEARRWMNAMILGMYANRSFLFYISRYDEEDPSSLIPIIDGGTEGMEFFTLN